MGLRRLLSRRKTQQPQQPVADRGVHGEGSYEGTRTYNAATRRFVASGRVDDAARRAAPRDAAEAKSIEQAEQAGAGRAKGEDPAIASRPRARAKGSTQPR